MPRHRTLLLAGVAVICLLVPTIGFALSCVEPAARAELTTTNPEFTGTEVTLRALLGERVNITVWDEAREQYITLEFEQGGAQ